MLVYLADSTRHLGIRAADRVRFLRRYLARRRGSAPPEAVRRSAEAIRRNWNSRHRRHMKSRTRRCVVESSQFTSDRSPRFTIHRRRTLSLAHAHRAIRWHEKAVAGETSPATVLKDSSRTQMTCCRLGDGTRVFVKAFLRTSTGERLKDTLRPRSRARGVWVAHRGFRVRGLSAPAGLALLEARHKLSGDPDYVLTRAADADLNLYELSNETGPRDPGGRHLGLADVDIRSLGRAVADLFRSLVEKRVRHRDMKPSNILVKQEEDGFSLTLVDLDRALFDVTWTRRHWVLHLAQCNAGLPGEISILSRMRALRRCARGRWDARQRLRIAREVLRKSLERNCAWEKDPPDSQL
jgi:hypothetical protein